VAWHQARRAALRADAGERNRAEEQLQQQALHAAGAWNALAVRAARTSAGQAALFMHNIIVSPALAVTTY
jgi:hypothetical protein